MTSPLVMGKTNIKILLFFIFDFAHHYIGSEV